MRLIYRRERRGRIAKERSKGARRADFFDIMAFFFNIFPTYYYYHYYQYYPIQSNLDTPALCNRQEGRKMDPNHGLLGSDFITDRYFLKLVF